VDDKVNLEIHKDKTKVYHFQNKDEKFIGLEVDEHTGERKNKTLEYLGFDYDGQRVLIKTAGYSKFNRSMKRSFKRATSLAIHAKTTDDKLHKSSLFKRFTYKGSKRRMALNGKTKTYRYDWGNYLSYVEKANASFKEFNNGDVIKKQSRKSWNRFNKLMKSAEAQIEDSKKN
jgi:hypothetical protein